MRERFGSINSFNWSYGSSAISAMAEESRPWEFGLFLLQDSKGGINHPFASARLRALIDQVSTLYRCQAGLEQSWLEAADALHKCDWNQPVSDPFNLDIRWSEHSALQVLKYMTDAALAKIAGNAPDWRHAMANAALAAGSYHAGIVRARMPSPPTPSAPLYDDRLKEIAAREVYLNALDKASDMASEAVYTAQYRYFSTVVGDIARLKQEAAEAEEARIAALAFPLRWKKRFDNWRQAS
jgi:hypothetical protein